MNLTGAEKIVAATADRARNGLVLIAIDSMGGSGKSTVAAAFADLCLQRLRDRGHDHGPIDWESRWRLAEEYYLATTSPRERADLIVSGAA